MRNILLLLFLAACARPAMGIDWYAWTQAMKISGNMRTERTLDGTPVDRELLVENFRRIAFDLEEFPLGLQQPEDRQVNVAHLRKWRDPMRYLLITLDEDRGPVLASVSGFMFRLVDITRHPIPRQSDQPAPNETANLLIVYGPDPLFTVLPALLTASDETEGELSDAKRAAMRSLAEFVASWRLSPSPCAGQIYEAKMSEDNSVLPGTILAAIVVIRRELPDELLQACIEEELSQVMGLLNDDPDARPSIYNDDQEFALLTEHDEYLLRILYDPRLEPGMSPEIAMPIVHQIVDELLPQG